MRSPSRYLLIALVGSAVVSASLLWFGYGRILAGPWTAALVVTAAHGAAFFLINEQAMRSESTLFFVWALGMNGVRFVALLLLILGLRLFGVPLLVPFVVALLGGYFCVLFSEIWHLHSTSLRR